MLQTAEESVSFCVREGLSVMFVTEDTTRADAATLRTLYGNAIDWGVRRICLSDTVGHATPSGVRALIRFVKREIIDASGESVKLDWHGHRDRGLGLANALAAIEAGADRIHATAMGIGERVGNVEMDLLLVNLALAGVHDADLARLAGLLRTGLARVWCPLASELSGAGRGRLPHGHRGARGRDRQGQD